jgi:hypothetical protein
MSPFKDRHNVQEPELEIVFHYDAPSAVRGAIMNIANQFGLRGAGPPLEPC